MVNRLGAASQFPGRISVVTVVAKILVVAEAAADAELVSTLLSEEFGNIVVSIGGDRFVEHFERHKPSVLVLAFDTLEKSERHYLGLYRRSSLVHSHPHWTLILCVKEELARAYELCRKRYFDDYMLFWPMSHDTTRLRMAVHHGLWHLAHLAGAATTAEVVAQTRPLLDLEQRLDQYMAQGKQHINSAIHNLQETPEDSGRAMRNVGDWADAFKVQLAPQIRAASLLQAVARTIPPVVLVVDDDVFQCKVLCQVLSGSGLDICTAHNGTAALAMLDKRRPDLIVMDINLPDMDGIEVTRRLKSIERFAAIPVIMITGNSEKHVVIDSQQAGAADFVVKPFNRGTLLAKIYKFLRVEPAPEAAAHSEMQAS